MKETSAAGNARAKTGSLRYVNCLAGYVSTGVTERLAFALMLNNYRHREPDPPPRADLDAVVLTLAGLRWRGADQSE
jgi:D-alanyl-D-alanine carboxypeptidase/D-alanyl-D-alanine-endopeptidase (penicillin-binding protein 4)